MQRSDDARAWEIVVLIGPCSEEEAEVVAESVSEFIYAKKDLDATVAMRPAVEASGDASQQTDTVKVVINARHGGFSLSTAGEIAYLARKGKSAYFYIEDPASRERPGKPDYLHVPPDEAEGDLMRTTLTEDIGERVPHDLIWPEGDCRPAYFDARDLERDDPDLVAVVEQLGDAASDELAKLKIVEVPVGVRWQIEENAGAEWVAEKHRTWQ